MTEPDAARAARAWCEGDVVAAIDAADRALADGIDPDGSAAAVAAAASAADGALTDAVARWRRIAEVHTGSPAVAALGRAALAGALTGHVATAVADLDAARAALADPAPRGLAVLLDGVEAVLAALHGEHTGAGRRLVGLAAATVPADRYAVEQWGDLAVTVAAAGGDAATAGALLSCSTTGQRRSLLAAWLDLCAGRFPQARGGLTAAATGPVLRRDAVLAAAVSVGLARRCGDADAVVTAWHRAAAVVAGAEVEVLLLDVWGELSVAAVVVSPVEGDALAAAMAVAVAAAGDPAWCTARLLWWRLQRAVARGDAVDVAAAAEELRAVDPAGTRTVAALAWADALGGTVDAASVRAAAAALVAARRPWEAAQLASAAAARASDPAVARELRGVAGVEAAAGADGLSGREREIGKLVLDGFTHREIGSRLYLSPKTVEQHVARLRRKLAAENRAELVAALRSRLAG